MTSMACEGGLIEVEVVQATYVRSLRGLERSSLDDVNSYTYTFRTAQHTES